MTGPRRGAFGPRGCIHLALRLLGVEPVHLRPGGRNQGDGDLGELDGIVISGGHDVEPVLYRAAPEVVGHYDPERDAFEVKLLQRALSRSWPILAICRGMQLLNVCLGGTLMQDLRARRVHTSGRRTLLPLKRLNLLEGTRLQSLVGRDEIRVNSLHRQAVDGLGHGLRMSAVDRDGIVQAIERPGPPFVLGVQWHPEFLLPLHAQRRVFAGFVHAAEQRAKQDPEARRVGCAA